MKFKILLAVVVIFFLTGATHVVAQQEFIWDVYKVKLTLPDDFKITKNTDHEFEADGQGMELTMYIFDDHKVTLDAMSDATVEVAKQMKLEHWDAIHDLEYNGFQGKYVLGAKGKDAVMIAGLMNPDNASNFWIAITFNDGDENAEKDGLKILNSIKTTK